MNYFKIRGKMKKKLALLGVMSCAIAMTAYFALGSDKTSNASLLMQNVEALAWGENDHVTCVAPWTPICALIGGLDGTVVWGTRQ